MKPPRQPVLLVIRDGWGFSPDRSADATNAATLVDRLSLLALGEPLPTASRTAVINAVNAYSSSTASGRTNRVKQAAFLVFASPQFQMTR